MEKNELTFSHKDYCSLMMYRISHRLEVIQNNILRKYGVSHQQTQLLAYIYARPEQDVFQKDLEKSFGLKSSTVTELLHTLENHGFIIRIPCEYDKRAKKLMVTQKAADLHESFMASIQAIEDIVSHGLSDLEKNLLHDLLLKVSENAENMSQ